MHGRRGRPLFFIDIAVPRDVEGAVGTLDGVYCYDIDDLKQVVDANIRERGREAYRAEALVEREVGKFLARLGEVEVIPTIVSLRERLEAIRTGEVKRTLARLPGATPETREAIEALSTAIVNKILHAPITKLRESSRAGSPRSWLELVHELFGLGRRTSPTSVIVRVCPPVRGAHRHARKPARAGASRERRGAAARAGRRRRDRAGADRGRSTPRRGRRVGGKGLFVREIEDMLLAGTLDCAVHSLKDLPAEVPAGLALAAFPEREDPRDVLVTPRPATLARPGARLGTGSPRRRALALALRADLVVEPIRGNVETRLRKLEIEGLDGDRARGGRPRSTGRGPAARPGARPGRVVPAVGQGVLAVETRADDRRVLPVLGRLDHAPTRACALAERACLGRLGASCNSPVAAHAVLDGSTIRITAIVASDDGRKVLRATASGAAQDGELGVAPNSRQGRRSRRSSRRWGVGVTLMARSGAARTERPLEGRTIVVTRARAQAQRFVDLLEAAGARVLQAPTIVIDPPASWEPLDTALGALESFAWVIFTV